MEVVVGCGALVLFFPYFWFLCVYLSLLQNVLPIENFMIDISDIFNPSDSVCKTSGMRLLASLDISLFISCPYLSAVLYCQLLLLLLLEDCKTSFPSLYVGIDLPSKS